jgi:hypothetical protein
MQGRSPHQRSLRGACRMLQEAHVPFGVITRKQLDDLGRYAVVVLPNVLRMDAEEIAALRSYVERGGRLLATGWTSLTSIDGVRHDDFALADVFGCSFDGTQDGSMVYAKPGDDLTSVFAPQRHLSANARGLVRARLRAGTALATLSLPFGHPHPGTPFDRHWSSIHSSPPHTHTDAPVIVEHAFGRGTSIYSSFDLEATAADVNDRVFVGLVRRLLDGRERFGARAHPSVWVTVFDQPHASRMTASFMNYQADLPPAPVTGTRLRLVAPAGRTFTGLVSAPDGEPVAYTVEDGDLVTTLDRIDDFVMLVASYS